MPSALRSCIALLASLLIHEEGRAGAPPRRRADDTRTAGGSVPKDRALWAFSAQQRARGFSREAMAAGYAALYREMIAGPAQREVA